MKMRALGLVVLFGCLPLAACNQQQAAKKENKLERTLGIDRGDRGDRGGRGHGLKRACAADIEKFCGNDRGRERRQCLQTHLDQLAADCKEAVEKRGAGRRNRDRQ